ncbi:class I SAM-dependent methyltransferase [Trichothermofontia sp.]
MKGNPPLGKINFGDLRNIQPISRQFGYDRGQPVDRYYIENFLNKYSQDIRGRVLEIGDDSYTRQFGGNRVSKRDVLHIEAGNPCATFVGDLTNADHIPSNIFDCLILTQTLQFIYEVPKALETVYRILKPNGVVLATFSGISQTPSDQWGSYHCWNFTTISARKLFEATFSPDNLELEAHGNVLTTIAFLEGISAEELTQEELNFHDRYYEMLITVRAVKTEES